MKKALSLFLACLMIVSSFGLTGYAAGDDGSILDDVLAPVNFNALIVPSDESQFNNFRYASPNGNAAYAGTISGGNASGYTEMPSLISSGVINNANLFGFTVKDLYHSSTHLEWNKIHYAVDDGEGNSTIINDYTTFTLAKAYTNKYLTKVFENRFGTQGSVDLFTLSNLITITNFIGNLVNPNYINLTPSAVDVPYTSDKDFYTSVVTLSGLRDIIANNWCNRQDLNYKAVLTLLGFDYDDEEMLGASKIYNADRVSRTLVRSVIKRIIQQGPVDYILDIIGNAAPYYSAYAPAIIALFSAQINAGNITENELSTPDGVFNLIINGNNPKDTAKLQLFSLPLAKIQTINSNGNVDKTKLFMILLLYFNLVGKWTTGSRVYTYFNGSSTVTEMVAVKNPDAVNRLINNTSDEGIKNIYKAFLKADFSGYLSFLTDESAKHMEEVKNPGPAAKNFLKAYLESILKMIADLFQKIYNSFKNFGDF